jgi:hypothetical protein
MGAHDGWKSLDMVIEFLAHDRKPESPEDGYQAMVCVSSLEHLRKSIAFTFKTKEATTIILPSHLRDELIPAMARRLSVDTLGMLKVQTSLLRFILMLVENDAVNNDAMNSVFELCFRISNTRHASLVNLAYKLTEGLLWNMTRLSQDNIGKVFRLIENSKFRRGQSQDSAREGVLYIIARLCENECIFSQLTSGELQAIHSFIQSSLKLSKDRKRLTDAALKASTSFRNACPLWNRN